MKCHESREHARSMKIDRILTGRYTAIPTFLAVMLLTFYLTFNVIGQRLSDWMDVGDVYKRQRSAGSQSSGGTR